MANINDIQKYCIIYNLEFLQGDEMDVLGGPGEIDEGIVALGMLKNHRLPVVILKDDGQVEVLKAWAKSTNEDDVWCIVTDNELTMGFRLHALE